MIRVEHGDCLEIIPTLGVTVDAVVCDPPYHLVPTLKRFGAANAAPAQHGKDGAMARLSAGFMSAKWDGGTTAFDPATWATVGSVLRPGGFLVAFGGTRTYHRLTCAIEDAGFVIQDCLMWLFASGFPKRRDMLKPAYEPIVLAYKPGGKRSMQIEECRIAADARPLRVGDYKDTDNTVYSGRVRGDGSFRGGSKAVGETDLGRWPANICHDGSDEVVAAFPESAGQQGDVTGLEPSSSTNNVYGQFNGRPPTKRRNEPSQDRRYTEEGGTDFAMLPGARRSDAGSAARFFFSAKAGSEDRFGSRHPTVKPVGLMKWLVQLVTPAGGLVLDPFAGSGTTGVAALATGRDAILIEREAAYVADIKERLAFYGGTGRHSMAAKNRSRKAAPGTLL